MKSFDSEIKKYTEKVRLKAIERNELRERILTYMEYHPLPKQSVRSAVESIESERFVKIHFNTLYTRIFSGVLALLFIVFIPFAAERSVPGDVLYPFKTKINEGVRMTLANSPYEKVVLETELLERRIAEARLLASEGRLTDDVSEAISETVREHASAAQDSIAALRTSNFEAAAIAEIAFGSALEIQSAVLATNDSTATSSTARIAGAVKEVQAGIEARRGTGTPSFAGLMARVELETTRAYELFEAIQDATNEEDRKDIERRLEDIGRKIAKAQSFESDNLAQAVQELTDALRLTQKLIVFMTDIGVSQSVELEALVPIELTDEERAAIAHTHLKNVIETRNSVAERINASEEEIDEKVTSGLVALDQRIARATSSLESGNIDDAESAIAEAYEYASDLDFMTKDITTIEEAEEGEEQEEGKEEEEPKEEVPETGTTTKSETTTGAEEGSVSA